MENKRRFYTHKLRQMNKNEISAGTNDEQRTSADNSTSASLEQNGMLGEGRLDAALALLAEYEEWEAELISDNRCWGPEGMNSLPSLTQQLYDKMLELQAKRNEVLDRFK